jgi:cyclophilin family peptidyl-prolyl cis-trans isomerase
MDVVDAIAKVETGRIGMHADVPMQEVVIEQVEIVED